MKKAFIVDSTLAANQVLLDQYNIIIQPLYAIINDKSRKDLLEVTPDEFYQELDQGVIGSTSQPSAGDFLETYEKLKTEGYTDVFVFTLSKKLSGTHQSATTASEMIEGIAVHVIDTNTASAIVTAAVIDIIEFAKTTDDVNAIIAFGTEKLARIDVFFYVASLDALKRGGRLSAAKALIGSLMQIKPILILKNGVIDIVGKERTLKKALRKITELVGQQQIEKVVLLETTRDDIRKEVEAEFTKRYPDVPYSVEKLSPVLGVHLGSEACAIGVIYKEEK